MRADGSDPHGEKRTPACTNCRRHKVKCVHSDPSDLSSPCLRCLKGNKDCVFDAGGRRRNKPNPTSSTSTLHRVNSDASVHKDQYKYKPSATVFGNGVQAPPAQRTVFSTGSFSTSTGVAGVNPMDFSVGSFEATDDVSGYQFGVSDSSLDSPLVKPAASQSASGTNGTNGRNHTSTPTYSPQSEDTPPEGQQLHYTAYPHGNISTARGPTLHSTQPGNNVPSNIDGLQQTLSTRNEEPNVPPQHQMLPHQSLFVDAIPMEQFRTYKMANPVNVMAIRDQMLAAWQKLTDRDTRRMESYENMDTKLLTMTTDKSLIEAGLLTFDEAQQRLECYRKLVYPMVPIVPIGDQGVTELIAERPLIFNTIMDITSRYIKNEAAVEDSMRIHNVAYLGLVKEVFIFGNKTLESYLALLLQIYFYNEPEFYHRTRVYSLTSAATLLAFDLGLGVAPLVNNVGSQELPRYEQIVTPHILVDSTNELCYKAWIASYTAMFNVLLSLRRPTPDLWNNYTRDAITYMLRLGDPKSVLIAQHAEYVHLHFDITERLFRKDNDSDVQSYSSPGTIYLISQFDSEIERLRRQTPRLNDKGMMFMYLSTRAFLHQGVLYTNYSRQFGRTPFTNFSLNITASELSTEAARSFRICYESAVGAVRSAMDRSREQFLFLSTPMMAQIVFNAGLILKCRALVMVNKAYAQAIGEPTDFIDDVSEVAATLDSICNTYPFSNMTLCLSFVIKLLMCHNDAVIHHIATKYSYNTGIVVPSGEGSPEDAEDPLQGPPSISIVKDDEVLPPHPGGLFKTDAHPVNEYLVAPDESLLAQNRRTSAVSLEGESVLRNTQLFPAEMEFEGEHPFWQMTEDFWEGVFPADGGMAIDL